MLKAHASRQTWLLVVMALLVLGAGLGLRDPWPSDEPRFALVAKQMVDSGYWLFPHRGPELYSDKPPMLMWWQASLYGLVDHWRVAFLLPSLLAALGTLWCVVDLGRRLWTRQVGLYAGWALLFALHFTFQAKKAQIDPLVVLFITLANYGLLRHLLLGPAWRWWWLGWFFAGIGVITKGVGVLALMMIAPAAVASVLHWPRVRLHVRDLRFWLAPLAFLLAVSLWLAPMLLAGFATGSEPYRAYMDDILFRQTARRYTQSWDHHQPWWYFFGVMPTMWIPAFLALPWAIPAWRRRLCRRDPPAAAPARCALPAAVGLVAAGRAVLLPSARQARRLHPAGIADVLPGAGAVAARVAEAARCAARAGRIHRVAGTGAGAGRCAGAAG